MAKIRRSMLVATAVAGLLVTGSGLQAMACGNGLIYALLFSKHPQAETAYKSNLEARRANLYQAPTFPATPGMTYHRWSFSRAEAVLARFHERMGRSAAVQDEAPDVTIMLADEVYVAYLSAGAEGPQLEQSFLGFQSRPGVVFYTTVNALAALNEGQIGWQQAMTAGLVVPRKTEESARLDQVFGPIFAAH